MQPISIAHEAYSGDIRSNNQFSDRLLGTLDDEIEPNKQMNKSLEEEVRVLFKSWFVPFDPIRTKKHGHWRPGQSLPFLPASLYDFFPDRLVVQHFWIEY